MDEKIKDKQNKEKTNNKSDNNNRKTDINNNFNTENKSNIINNSSKNNNVENKENKKLKEKNPKKQILLLFIILLIILFFSTIFSLTNMNTDKIISGVSIEGIDVSGMSSSEAKNKLEPIYNEKKDKDITLKYGEYTATINPELLDANFNLEDTIQNAISFGKKDNIFINNYKILSTLINKKNIQMNITINEENTKQKIEDISNKMPGTVIESSYYIEGDKLIITKGKEGLKINEDELLSKIKDNLHDTSNNNNYIEIPVTTKIPEAIDIDKIHSEVYKEVKDAYFTKDPFQVYPEVEGIDFDVNKAKELLKEDKEEYDIQLTITKPKVTISNLGSEAFPNLLGTCSTRYDASLTDRSTNLALACQKLNNKVLLPGETFSYNKTLGERTIAAGYKNGKVYENGQVVDGIGGGICQISSTLYNAVLKSNLEIVERKNHQFVTSYLPAGQDATVVYGLTDFQFKNTRNYAIKISASATNGIATVSIYGIKENQEYTITLNTKTISTIPFTIKYEDDPTLNPGQEVIKQYGANGIITETYITKSLNGKVVSSTLLSKDTYNAMQRIIRRGTNSSPQTQNTATPTEPQSDTTSLPTPVTPTTSPSNFENQQQTQTQQTNSTQTTQQTEVQPATNQTTNSSTQQITQ